MRGRKARAKEGRFCGGGAKLYGYDYIKVSQQNGGRRVINEIEAPWFNRHINGLSLKVCPLTRLLTGYGL